MEIMERLICVAGRSIQPVEATGTIADLLKLLNYYQLSYSAYKVPSIALWDGAIQSPGKHYDRIPATSRICETVDSSHVIYITKTTEEFTENDRITRQSKCCQSTDDTITISDSEDDNDRTIIQSDNTSHNDSRHVVLNEQDYESLRPRQWLNDQIINSYMQLLMLHYKDNVCITSTFFYTKLSSHGFNGVRRWIKKVKLFDSMNIIIPIHLNGNHWTIVYVDISNRMIKYYDSLGGKGTSIVKKIQKLFMKHTGRKHLGEASTCKLKVAYVKFPRQLNTFDCGVYICQYAKSLCQDLYNHSTAAQRQERGNSKIVKKICPSKIRKQMKLELHNQSLMV